MNMETWKIINLKCVSDVFVSLVKTPWVFEAAHHLSSSFGVIPKNQKNENNAGIHLYLILFQVQKILIKTAHSSF